MSTGLATFQRRFMGDKFMLIMLSLPLDTLYLPTLSKQYSSGSTRLSTSCPVCVSLSRCPYLPLTKVSLS